MECQIGQVAGDASTIPSDLKACRLCSEDNDTALLCRAAAAIDKDLTHEGKTIAKYQGESPHPNHIFIDSIYTINHWSK